MLTLDRPDGYLKKYWGINLIYMDVKNYKKDSDTNSDDL